MKVIRLLSFTAYLVLVSLSIIAQQEGVRFVAKASPSTVGTEEKFTLTYTVNERAGNFQIPDNLTKYFMVLMGPSTSTQQTFSFGNYETTTTISYVLRSKAAGNFTITPAKIVVGGNIISSNPVEIQVVEGKTKQADPNDPEEIAKSLAWMRAFLSRTSVYVGEPINLRYKLYYKANVGNPIIEDEPNFRGFLVENVAIPDANRQKREFVDNEQVMTSEVKSVLLIPQQPGSHDSKRIDVIIPTNVPTQRRDFFGGVYTVRVDNRTFFRIPEITVKPLPAAGRPENFSGGVGHFQFEAKVNRNDIEVDKAISLTLTLKGSGNIRLAELPEPEIPNVFEVYDPRVNQNYQIEATTVRGTKSAEYVLIPRYAGEFVIPSMNFSYFDPKNSTYKNIRTEPITIKVSGDPQREVAGGANDARTPPVSRQEQIDILSSDIMYINTNVDALKKVQTPILFKTGYWIMFFVLIALFPLTWFLRNLLFARRLARGSRLRKAEEEAFKLIKNARDNSQTANSDLYRALEVYFLARLGLPRSEFSRDMAEKQSRIQFDESFTKEWMGLLSSLEEQQYSGFAQTESKVDQVEKIIKTAQQW